MKQNSPAHFITSIIVKKVTFERLWKTRCWSISALVSEHVLCSNIWSFLCVWEDSRLSHLLDWIDCETSWKLYFVTSFCHNQVWECIKVFIENNIRCCFVTRNDDKFNDCFLFQNTCWVILNCWLILDQIEISIHSLNLSERFSCIDWKTNRKTSNVSLYQVKIWTYVCNYCHNLFKKLVFTLSKALWNVSAPFETKMVQSCMCQRTGFFFHPYSTFSE